MNLGEDYLDQIQRIVAVLGTPTAEDMSYIGNKNAINYIKGLPKRSKQSWLTVYPQVHLLFEKAGQPESTGSP
jgi:mitogen-activated protein kinase 1/3